MFEEEGDVLFVYSLAPVVYMLPGILSSVCSILFCFVCPSWFCLLLLVFWLAGSMACLPGDVIYSLLSLLVVLLNDCFVIGCAPVLLLLLLVAGTFFVLHPLSLYN